MMNEVSDQPQMVTTQKSTAPWWYWMIAGMFLCCFLACVGMVGSVWYIGTAPEGLIVEYTKPSVVKRDDSFDLIFTITNKSDKPFTITEIELDKTSSPSILDGATVLDVNPRMERDYSLEGRKTFMCNLTIQPGETMEIVFRLKAAMIGEFGGPVRIYVGSKSTSFGYIGIVVQE